jgi:hypothetical protein
MHSPARYENESFAAYKERRAKSNAAAHRIAGHGLSGGINSRQRYRDDMRKSGTMGKRIRASDALMAAWAAKRITKAKRRDEKGAYTLTGRNLPVYGMHAWNRNVIVGWTPGRRVWVGGVSATVRLA